MCLISNNVARNQIIFGKAAYCKEGATETETFKGASLFFFLLCGWKIIIKGLNIFVVL